jgi:hypothetical protein
MRAQTPPNGLAQALVNQIDFLGADRGADDLPTLVISEWIFLAERPSHFAL